MALDKLKKYIGQIIVLFSILGLVICCFSGYYFTKNLKNEKNLLKGIIRFNKNMLINLEYQKVPLSQFINNYNDSSVSALINNYLKQLKKGKKIVIECKNKGLKYELENYFNTLGKSDANSQIEFAKSYDKIFINYYNEFCGGADKKIALYPKLGVMVGGIVFILLI